MSLQTVSIMFLSLFVFLYIYVLIFRRPWDLESFFTSFVAIIGTTIWITLISILFYVAVIAAFGGLN